MRKFEVQQLQLESRELLSYEESSEGYQSVYRIECCSSDDLCYKVGDALGVLPRNSRENVDVVLHSLGAASTCVVQAADKSLPLVDFLTSFADLTKISKKIRSYLPNEVHENATLIDILREDRVKVSPQEFASSLFPLLPRFYSLVSSPEVSPRSCELLVRLVGGSGGLQYGVCSSFLCKHLQLKDTFSSFIQPTRHFTLTPEMSGKPLVMIGAGTGIAPFKGFLQQRMYHKDPGENFLFFGERHYNEHFYFRTFWEDAVLANKLRFFVAFSRDQQEKIYVQDLLRQQANLIQSIANQGAIFFVCGKKILSKEVKAALEDILGKEAFAILRQEQRYLIDVY